ncbi:MAG: sulfate adenylyltransferase [Nitrospirae bacterium]|nr:sulfate adenylyltransferase [Nitrospirota bacterium]
MPDRSIPHGETLVNRMAPTEQRPEFERKAAGLPKIALNAREQSDLDLIAVGAYSPIEGFMGRKDYESVRDTMHLANGLPWSLPIILAVDQEQAKPLHDGRDVALTDERGTVLAILHLEERYQRDKAHAARAIYRTEDTKHPGVEYLFKRGDVLLGGTVDVLRRQEHQDFLEHRLAPADTRKAFAERGWKTVVGFQTRNPIHRAHEYIQKCALEIVDGLFIHPLVGETKSDDIPADVRMKCYRVLLDNYYPKNRTLLGVLPAAMRYAGPREAIFHALVRKNYGCTHFIVGRDHAGVGNFYGSFDAHHIFAEFKDGELGITPLFFDHTFYCKQCVGMASTKTCPHDSTHHVALSGTKVREMLSNGVIPPVEFSRPEVAKVLIEAMRKPA